MVCIVEKDDNMYLHAWLTWQVIWCDPNLRGQKIQEKDREKVKGEERDELKDKGKRKTDQEI